MILVAAVALGGLAAFVLFSYVNRAEDRAYADSRRVPVWVVKQDILKGTPGDQALAETSIDRDEIPQEFRPATAVTDANSIKGLVAVNDFVAGQVLVNGMFVSNQDAFVTTAGRLTDGRVAITISVDPVRGVAGLVVPGDKVNILVKADDASAGLAAPAEGEPPADPAPEEAAAGRVVLFQAAEVLAIGTSLAPDVGATEAPINPGSNMLTLSVPPEAASRIALASEKDIYLTLVGDDYVPIEIPVINDDNLVPDDALTPYPADEADSADPAAADPQPQQ